MVARKKGLPTTFKHCELVLYEDSNSPEDGTPIHEWIKTLTLTRWFEYAMIRHDMDEKKVHWHLLLRFKTPWKTGDILAKFGVGANQISRIKGKWGDALSYLTHANEPEKHQYDVADVYSNFDWQEERRIGITERLHRCASGEIRRYNYTNFFSDSEFMKHDAKIKKAFRYRSDYVMQHLEEQIEKRDVVWIFGDAGTGKTSLAKRLANTMNLAFRITSTGQHMFDEYKDEPCLIIDDIRPDDCGFADLLGILDPFNNRAIGSRYENKANQAELIVITCPFSPEQFYSKSGVKEPKEQLFRRINTVYEMGETKVYEYTWDGIQWNKEREFPNLFAAEARKSSRKSKHISDMVDKAFAQFAAEGF